MIKTAFIRLGANSTSLGGLRFRGLVSVDETARPPGNDVPPAVLGPIDPAGYVLDSAAGEIRRAPGLEPVWARVVYQYDDSPYQADLDATQAAADADTERPQLRSMLVQALADLDQEEARAAQIQTQMAAQIAAFGSDPALPASPTAAQLRSAIVTLATRDLESVTALRDAALGAQRNVTRTRRVIRLLAAMAGIPLPVQGLR